MKIALVCYARNEDRYIEEWVQYHIKLGFDKIIIWQDRWECKYEHPQIIKLKMRQTDTGRSVAAQNHFIDEMSHEYDYAAFFDVDEFLVLKKHSNVKDFVAEYSDCQSIGINWVFFGNNGQENVIDNDYSVIKRFTKRRIEPGEPGSELAAVKQILKLDQKIHMCIHHPQCLWHTPERILCDGPGTKHKSVEIAQLNHYWCKTKQEFVEKKMIDRPDDQVLGLWNYERYNFNEIEDLAAYNFFYNKNNS